MKKLKGAKMTSRVHLIKFAVIFKQENVIVISYLREVITTPKKAEWNGMVK